jgi:hypothetical protein
MPTAHCPHPTPHSPLVTAMHNVRDTRVCCSRRSSRRVSRRRGVCEHGDDRAFATGGARCGAACQRCTAPRCHTQRDALPRPPRRLIVWPTAYPYPSLTLTLSLPLSLALTLTLTWPRRRLIVPHAPQPRPLPLPSVTLTRSLHAPRVVSTHPSLKPSFTCHPRPPPATAPALILILIRAHDAPRVRPPPSPSYSLGGVLQPGATRLRSDGCAP